MYHEEKIINGVLCFRNTPNTEFVPYSSEALTVMIKALDDELNKRVALLDRIKEHFYELPIVKDIKEI